MENKGEQKNQINNLDENNKDQADQKSVQFDTNDQVNQELEEEALDNAQINQSDEKENAINEQIIKLESEVAEKTEAFLRAKAETENVRRRAIEERAKTLKFAIENFAIDLLPVVDALRASIDNKDAPPEKLIEGIVLTEKMFINVLENNSVKEIPALNEKFNPNIHEAMTMEESDIEPGSIVRVFQSGFQLNDRTIRPAMVVVAKKKEKS